MLNVRVATRDDADAIGEVHVATWRAAYASVFPDSMFDIEARQRFWRSYFDEPWPGSAVFVAEDDGEVTGFASLGRSRDDSDERSGELFAIYVHPHRWDTGTGRALIARGEAFLRGTGYGEAMLWVLEGNERAARFYRAAGWTHDGGRKVEAMAGVEVVEVRYRKPL